MAGFKGLRGKGDRNKEPERPPNPDGSQETNVRRRVLILCILALPVLIGFYALLLWWSTPRTPGDQLTLTQYLTLLRQGRVQDATLLDTDNRVFGTYDRGQYWVAFGTRETVFSRVTSALEEAGVPTTVKQQPLKGLVVPLSVLLPVLILVDSFVIFFVLMRGGGGDILAFGRSRARRLGTGESKITFSEVAGVDEAIEELKEIRDYLANPERFLAMGAAVPKGILLVGPPGCGKTLLARAVAGESEVPFFSISGSDFVEIFVGVGAARIRDLFRTAKANAPAIVFIDELDAVGRGRTASAIGGQDEREATLNQLLVELDGFDSGTGVVVLSATNRPDILDAALLRPGRFDRRVTVDRPDVRGREGILKIHARGKPLSPDVELALVAKRTAGFSGADLANVVNEAALLAARRASAIIEPTHISEAIERVLAGPERRSRIISPEDRRRIAFHEAGHAVTSAALPAADRVGKVSIVARGHGGGFTWYVTEGDQVMATRSQLLDRVAGLLAGRACEMLIFGEPSTGANDDLERAAEIAKRMVCEFGMSERMGPFSVKPFVNASISGDALGPPFSERVASDIDHEVQAVLREGMSRAAAILDENRGVLEALARKLIEVESLEGDGLDEFLLQVTKARAALGTAG
ncbi:MAG: ATP-dependent zinc metalloprotease FtsH [Actinomycetota bacterium]